MSIVHVLRPWLHRGQHRLTDAPQHGGWEGIEDQVRLLAEDEPSTTKPLRGVAPPNDCPIDQCTWQPDEQQLEDDPHARLLEHLRWHPPNDVVHTIARLRRSIVRLQDNT